MKKSVRPAVKLSIWEGIIFNRSYEHVGQQRMLAKMSKRKYGRFLHIDGYCVLWTKYKLDSVFLPEHFKNSFFHNESDMDKW